MAKRNIYLNGVYLRKNPAWHSEDASWKASQILKMIVRNNLKIKNIADVGCGSGMILEYLSGSLPFVTRLDGFDVSPDAINLCRKIKQDKVKFYLQDFSKKKEASHYDLILIIDVIEHLENYFEFLKNLRLKGKYKILNIPLDLSVQMVSRGSPLPKLRNDVGHLHYFTKETAIAALKESKYQIVDYFYAPWSLTIPGRSLRMKLIGPLRRMLFRLNRDLTVRFLGGYSLVVLAR